MQYYNNDLPRLLVGDERSNITQNSCYRPERLLKTIATLLYGGMPTTEYLGSFINGTDDFGACISNYYLAKTIT
jgi:hypothetical protein